jgi:ParB family chromosome partitioning protein
MSDTKRRSLGRGLAALLGDEDEAVESGGSGGAAAPASTAPRSDKALPIADLNPNPFQPRRVFDEEALETLAESIRANGLLQPILVRAREDGEGYDIVAGERRWRAAQQAQLHEVPVVIRDLGEREALEIAIVENVQRRDLTPLEEAEGYRRLMAEFKHTQDDVAKAVAKSRSHVANMLRLLQLPESVQQMVQAGRISAGHARALLNAEDVEGLAQQVAERGISVRETERLAQDVKAAANGGGNGGNGTEKAGKGAPPVPRKDADTRYLEDELSAALGLKVSVDAKGKGGKLVIEYATLDQLDNVIAKLRDPEPA